MNLKGNLAHKSFFHFNIQESYWQEMTFLLVLPFCWWGGALNVTFYRIFVTLRDAIKWQKGKKNSRWSKTPRKSIRKQMFQTLCRKLFVLTVGFVYFQENDTACLKRILNGCSWLKFPFNFIALWLFFIRWKTWRRNMQNDFIFLSSRDFHTRLWNIAKVYIFLGVSAEKV